MNAFGIVLSAVVLALSGCNPGRYLKKTEVAKVNSYCAEGQPKANVDIGKALINRLTKIAKDPLKSEIMILRDNCGKWPRSFSGIPADLNNAGLQTLYESIGMNFQ